MCEARDGRPLRSGGQSGNRTNSTWKSMISSGESTLLFFFILFFIPCANVEILKTTVQNNKIKVKLYFFKKQQ